MMLSTMLLVKVSSWSYLRGTTEAMHVKSLQPQQRQPSQLGQQQARMKGHLSVTMDRVWMFMRHRERYHVSTTPFEDGERPRTWSGTSMSSPHVAGIAAVLRADSVQDLSPVQVKDKIYRNAKFLSEHPRRGQVLLANLVAGGCNAGVTPPTDPSNPPSCSDIINGGQCKGTEGCLWKKGTCVGM